MSRKSILRAMTTPLASIFGSGFLVIVPILASAVGPYSVLAMVVVGGVAILVGSIVRHNILCAEPVLEKGSSRVVVIFEQASDLALVVAYVISVCLYIHILSAFVLGGLGLDSATNKSLLTSTVIALITAIGLAGRLNLLERLERWALYLTLMIIAILLVGFGIYDLKGLFSERGIALPAMPNHSAWRIVTIVAGTLIVVQGFETTRYLGTTFDTWTRILASRWSQYLSIGVYIAFVALALPIASVLGGRYDDNSLIVLAGAASILLPIPLIVGAALSQFSAAVADTVAAAANLQEATRKRFKARWGYLLVGGSAIALAWSGSTFEIVVLASRAFAFYYLMQCVVGFAVCRSHWWRARFIAIGLVLTFILIVAVPAG